jgi:hypothetical protein
MDIKIAPGGRIFRFAVALTSGGSFLLRRCVQPDQRLSRAKNDDALSHGRRGFAVAEIEKEAAGIVPKQCLPGLAGGEGLSVEKRNSP